MNIAHIHQLFLTNPIVCTDTRNIQPGAIFFALKGGNFNGNAFALQAIQQGCAFAIVDEDFPANDSLIQVDNVLECLQQLATYHRKFLNIPIIAITGSNGKTTTKELVSKVLQKRYNTFATNGNLNNHIGVPLSLLSLTKKHELAVIEMGANHQGEIAMLCAICLPNYGLITNIGKAHLEGFGGEEGVIKGKSELFKFIRKANGLLFVNADDDLLVRLSKGIDTQSYGTTNNANHVYYLDAENPAVQFTIATSKGTTQIYTKLSGKYNFYNLAAAAAIGSYFGVDDTAIQHALETYESDNNRSQTIRTAYNTLFLDAYNANPSSMAAAIENFCTTQKPNTIAIIGGMNELGETSDEEHRTLVNNLSSKPFAKIFLVGNHFAETAETSIIKKFDSVNDVLSYLATNNIKDANIFIKGSRTNTLEKLVASL